MVTEMILAKGDMFKSYAHAVIVTGNATMKNDGAIVMGAGAAKQARDKFPGVDKAFGDRLNKSGHTIIRPHQLNHSGGDPYGLLLTPRNGGVIALFQVKWHFKSDADLELIAYSSEQLRHLAMITWQHWTISLNFPGIGNGRISKESVMPIISRLPDNVTVWERE